LRDHRRRRSTPSRPRLQCRYRFPRPAPWRVGVREPCSR
jgi:hypothetical protein